MENREKLAVAVPEVHRMKVEYLKDDDRKHILLKSSTTFFALVIEVNIFPPRT